MTYRAVPNPSVMINDVFELHPKILDTLNGIRIEISGETNFSRNFGLNDKFTRVFYAHVVNADSAMALVGIEDLDAHFEPDGWTDVLLPIFYGVAPNQGNLTRPIIFIDALFSGAYSKKLFLNGTMLMTYSVEYGLRILDIYPYSVGYVEYDPVTGDVLNIK